MPKTHTPHKSSKGKNDDRLPLVDGLESTEGCTTLADTGFKVVVSSQLQFNLSKDMKRMNKRFWNARKEVEKDTTERTTEERRQQSLDAKEELRKCGQKKVSKQGNRVVRLEAIIESNLMSAVMITPEKLARLKSQVGELKEGTIMALEVDMSIVVKGEGDKAEITVLVQISDTPVPFLDQGKEQSFGIVPKSQHLSKTDKDFEINKDSEIAGVFELATTSSNDLNNRPALVANGDPSALELFVGSASVKGMRGVLSDEFISSKSKSSAESRDNASCEESRGASAGASGGFGESYA